jgi:hypothetical protein
MERVALGLGDREARHGHCLAPQGISYLLVVESPARQARATSRISRDSRADPPHEPRESGLGRAFLENHLQNLVSVDFFTVPTIRFQILYVFLVLAHERRRIIHFAVTAHPTAEWTAHQLREAFPWESAPR